jgi:hypothetical protein
MTKSTALKNAYCQRFPLSKKTMKRSLSLFYVSREFILCFLTLMFSSYFQCSACGLIIKFALNIGNLNKYKVPDKLLILEFSYIQEFR